MVSSKGWVTQIKPDAKFLLFDIYRRKLAIFQN